MILSDKKLISIIIPVYNLEKYIEACLESVLKQTYDNFEVIIVNDGSIDNSLIICNKLSKNDKRINIITQPNQGVSSARNHGLDESHGDYITFIDGDDTIDKDYLTELYNGIISNDADISACSFINFFCDGKITIEEQPTEIYDFQITDHVLEHFECCWGKLFKRTLIDNYKIWFDTNYKYGEDTDFVYRYLMHCNKVYRISKPLYNYYRREISASYKFNIDYYKTMINVFNLKYKFATQIINLPKENLEQYLSKLTVKYYLRAIEYYSQNCRINKRMEIYKNVVDFFSSYLKQYNNEKLFTNDQKRWVKRYGHVLINKSVILYIILRYFYRYYDGMKRRLIFFRYCILFY